MTQLEKFCRCIKAVSKTVKRRPGQKGSNEGPAIAICVKSVIQKKRGRTLKKFKCRAKAFLLTQKAKAKA